MKKEAIVLENLALLSEQREQVGEKRLYEMSELSRLAFAAMEGEPFSAENEEFLRKRYSSVFSLGNEAYDTVMYPCRDAQNEAAASQLSQDATAFALFFAELVAQKGDPRPPWSEKKGAVRIAYVPSSRSDSAYLAIAEKRRDASVLYVENATSAVQAVLSGEAAYALLPYMAAGDTVLPGTVRLIDSHELYINGVVTLTEEEEHFSFALLSPLPAPLLSVGDMRLSLRLTADSYAHLGRMLSAFSAFGYAKAELSATKEEYGRVCAQVTLGAEGNTLALWAYLSLYSVGFTLRGRYPLIYA